MKKENFRKEEEEMMKEKRRREAVVGCGIRADGCGCRRAMKTIGKVDGNGLLKGAEQLTDKRTRRCEENRSKSYPEANGRPKVDCQTNEEESEWQCVTRRRQDRNRDE